MKNHTKALFVSAFCSQIVCLSLTLPVADAAEPKVDFNTQVRPIISGRCMFCHGPDEDERAAGLRLDTFEGATEDLGGYSAIAPGHPGESELIARLITDDEDMRMPPGDKFPPLSKDEVDVLRRWIKQGADYAPHWAYVPPVKHDVPSVDNTTWNQTAVDRYLFSAMTAQGLTPSEPADRLTIARRVAIDLTGLPPTWEQAQQFNSDKSEDAYERYVDLLLASPKYGERWARVWLDLARYADSAGYADDPPRTIWLYRDYVIKSLNENKSFRDFTIEQIAGDLLPDPTDEQLVATAFHRNTLTNNEGGTNDEEFRNVAVVDRVNTTMAVWMGTTMACAQCHTHKYDPITHEDYFSFFAFFNQSEDADRRDERPILDVWTDELLQKKQSLESQLESVEASFKADTPEIIADRKTWLEKLRTPPEWSKGTIADASAKNRSLTIADNGAVVAEPDPDESPENDVYNIALRSASEAPVTALRLEIPETQASNFVLSQVRAEYQPDSEKPQAAKFLRITLPGKGRLLQLAEVQAITDGKNVAVHGSAKQSSTYPGGEAFKAIDGNTSGKFSDETVAHSSTEANPWWEVEFDAEHAIDEVVIWNRTDGGASISNRLQGFEVQLLNAERNVVWSRKPNAVPRPEGRYAVESDVKVEFAVAIADFQQKGFPADSVIQPKVDRKAGWAIGGGLKEPHQLTLILKSPIAINDGTLQITLDQDSVHKQHLIDMLRFSITSSDSVRSWVKMPDEVRSVVTQKSELSAQQSQAIARYHRSITPLLKQSQKQAESLRKQIATLKPVTVPVMRELSKDKWRETHIQIRGNYSSKGDEVSARTPEAFHEFGDDLPVNRLGLAHWLVDDANPLTARVVVNRHWEQIFGRGIVPTSEEFGSQGELPTHPKLLDHLAVDLQENGWDIKRLLKQLVMTAAYRQSSLATAAKVNQDPANAYLSRGPRHRISAEMVRDQALFVSGLLSEKMHGPPVNPPQPELGLKAAFGGKTDWETSDGEDRYRRGLYTMWRRSNPYPSMAAFDAPNREVCTVNRGRTNTPLQALVTLNDPVYVEAAQALSRTLIESSSEIDVRIVEAFRRALLRQPSQQETERLARLYQTTLEHFAEMPISEAEMMATEPLGELSDDVTDAILIDHAAMTVVCNVIMNLDEFFLKR